MKKVFLFKIVSADTVMQTYILITACNTLQHKNNDL